MGTDYFEFARKLSYQAGQMIRNNFLRVANSSEKRPDRSYVTAIDRALNRLLIEAVSAEYPGHGVLGAEEDFGTGNESFQWVCDPLGGTTPFLLGIPSSIFMLALTFEARPVAATVYDPFGDYLYHAQDSRGAYCNGKQIRVSNEPLSSGFFVFGSDAIRFESRIAARGGQVEAVAGNGYKCMLIARGSAVGTIKGSADFHDVTPAAFIISEAGGVVTDFDGRPVQTTSQIKGGVILSNRASHDELLAVAQAAASRAWDEQFTAGRRAAPDGPGSS